MARKWSQQATKTIVSINDEMLIIDTEESNPSIKNKRITLTDLLRGIVAVFGKVKIIGDYDATTNTPDLDVSPTGISAEDMFVVSVSGLFFTEQVETFDVVIAKKTNPTVLADWVIVQGNLTPSTIKIAYENNANTNQFSDAEQTKLANLVAGAQAGDVVGPVSATNDALVRFDTTTGLLVQNSNAILTDGGSLTLPGSIKTNQVTVENTGAGGDVFLISNSPTSELIVVGDLVVNPSLKVADFIQKDAINPASSGFLRLASTELIGWRNPANDNNSFISFNISNQFSIIIDSIPKYDFTVTEADFKGNNIIGMGFITFDKITVPVNPPIEEGRSYVKEIDANNNGLFIKIKKAGVTTEVQIT